MLGKRQAGYNRHKPHLAFENLAPLEIAGESNWTISPRKAINSNRIPLRSVEETWGSGLRLIDA